MSTALHWNAALAKLDILNIVLCEMLRELIPLNFSLSVSRDLFDDKFFLGDWFGLSTRELIEKNCRFGWILQDAFLD